MENQENPLTSRSQADRRGVDIQNAIYWRTYLDLMAVGILHLDAFTTGHEVKDAFVPNDFQ
jgi:hypothetical protein